MVGDGWRWLEMSGNGWRWLEMAGGGWRWLKMAGDGWRVFFKLFSPLSKIPKILQHTVLMRCMLTTSFRTVLSLLFFALYTPKRALRVQGFRFDEFFPGFRAKFQKIVTCVAFSIKFAKTNQKFAENSEFCEKNHYYSK